MVSIREQLKEFLRTAKDWEKMETPLQGVYVVKVPGTKTRGATLYLEINPLDDYGKPLKKRGLFVGRIALLNGFIEGLSNDKSFQLMKYIERVNNREPIKPEYNLKIEEITEEKELIVNHKAVELIKDEIEEEIEEGVRDESDKNYEVIQSDNQPEIRSPKSEPETKKRLYVDIVNILHGDLDKHDRLKTENIPKIYQTIKDYGYHPMLIADASSMYKVDNKIEFEKIIDEKIVKLAPAGRTADIYILKLAKKRKCKFLSNDMFRDYYDEFGEDWIKDNRITGMFEDGELIID